MAKIAILANFAEINHGYSLTGIVEDQIEMLAARGHDVDLFVQESFNFETTNERFRLAGIHAALPRTNLVDYVSQADLSDEHAGLAWQIEKLLTPDLTSFDLVITHDWIFTGWNYPYALSVSNIGQSLPDLQWLHWVHSIPSGQRDWWDIKKYGPRHRVVYPNLTDLTRAAEAFRSDRPGQVIAIPHIKDPRSWFDFCPETCALIDQVPGLMAADVVQVLPASTDRLKYKGVEDVIRIFAVMKGAGRSVCLFVANQWATGRGQREDVAGYLHLAENLGLAPGREVVFSSELDEGFQSGLSRRVIRELFLLSNLFVFPTHHESFGLVVPEAALSGVYFAGNRSLSQQLEVAGGAPAGAWFPFGSYESVPAKGGRAWRPEWLKAVALLILREMDNNATIQAKTRARQTLNRDAIYNRYYAPILAEGQVERMAD